MEMHETLLAALNGVVAVRGTDLVLTVGSRPLVRVDAAIRPLAKLPVVDDDAMDEVSATCSTAPRPKRSPATATSTSRSRTATSASAATSSTSGASRRSRSG